MSQLLSYFLTLLVSYGYPTVALVILISGFGAPLPASTIILAAGSFTVDGPLNFWVLVSIVTVMAIIGDLTGYFIAHRFGDDVTKLTRRYGIGAKQLASIDRFLLVWGVWFLFLTRWLITPLGFPVNLVAGFRKYPLRKFFVFISIGEFFWALIYSYLGHVFGVSWSSLVVYLNGAPEALSFLAIGVVTAIVARKMWMRQYRKPYAKTS